MTIIDSHQHFWTAQMVRPLMQAPEVQALLRDFLPSDLKPLLDDTGVQQTVLVSGHSGLANTPWFLKQADETDWVAAVVTWVDLRDPAVGEELDTLREHPKFKGVRHQWEEEPDPAWVMRDDVLRGLREVGKRGLRYDVLARPWNWEYIPKLANAVPDLPLVIDHIAKPSIRDLQFDDWAVAMATAAEFPQMMCKLSGMVTEAAVQHWSPSDLRPYVHKAIELFGVDRVMFGSDWPVCTLAASYSQVFHALLECLDGLSESEKAHVLGDNARTFYGIDQVRLERF